MIGGTTLAHAEVLPVSAMTGQGVDALRAHLEAAPGRCAIRSQGTRFRLAVDRVFTLVGRRRCGDRDGALRFGPYRRPGADQPIRAHGAGAISCMRRTARPRRAQQATAARSTSRVRTSRKTRSGAAMSCSTPTCTRRRIASTPLLASCPAKRSRSASGFRSASITARRKSGARIVLLDDRPIAPGDEAEVQLVLDRPIAAAAHGPLCRPRRIGAANAGRRRVPRSAGRRPASGGRPKGRRSARRLRFAIRSRPSPRFWPRRLSPLTSPSSPATALFPPSGRMSSRQPSISSSSKPAIRRSLWRASGGAFSRPTTLDRIAAYHAENPDLQGLGREELRITLQPRLPKPAFDAALQKLAGANDLVLDGAFVRLPFARGPGSPPEDKAAWETDRAAARRGRSGSGRRECATLRRRPVAPRQMFGAILKRAGRMGWADEVAHDHFFLRSTVREMVADRCGSDRPERKTAVFPPRSSATASTTAARSRSKFSTSSIGTA